MAQAGSTRLIQVDALRGIAAMAVVLFHYTTRFDQLFHHASLPSISFPLGHYGVNLFFIISGFVIFMTLEKVGAPVDFVVTRFSRLYPAYWTAIALTLAVTHTLGLPEHTVDGWAALANLLMFHGLLFKVPHVDGVYWTLQVELLFYFWMLLLFLGARLEKVSYALLGLLALRFAYFLCERLMGISLPWKIYQFLILGQIPWFAIGICVYRIAFHANAPHNRLDRITLVAAVLVLLAMESAGIAGFALVLAAIVFGAATGRLPILSTRLLVWLGTISYTLYLVHENIGWSIMLRLRDLGWGTDMVVLSAIAISLALASAVTYLVERPAMAGIRKWYRSHKERRAG